MLEKMFCISVHFVIKHYNSIPHKKLPQNLFTLKTYSYSYPDPDLFPLFCIWISLSGKSKACQ